MVKYKVLVPVVVFTVICDSPPLTIFDVVNPTTSPARYPLPAVVTLTELTTLLDTVTLACAPDPLPVIANNGTLENVPFE